MNKEYIDTVTVRRLLSGAARDMDVNMREFVVLVTHLTRYTLFFICIFCLCRRLSLHERHNSLLLIMT